jgi:hypothetical protein
MATEFILTAENNPEIFRDVTFKDAKKTYSFDFTPWAEDNHDVTTVTWTVQSGQAAVSGQALTSNVATALVTFSQAGRSLIQVKGATASNEVFIAHLDVVAKDPEAVFIDDYGICV